MAGGRPPLLPEGLHDRLSACHPHSVATDAFIHPLPHSVVGEVLKVSDYDRLTGQRLCPPSEGKMEDGQDERERVETAGRSGAGAGGVAEQRGGGGGAGDIGAADAPSAGTGWRIGAQRGAARQHGARAGESGGGAGTGPSGGTAVG